MLKASLLPERRYRRVDLGAGDTKAPGFIGVDRFALPGIDIVADLEAPLPFGDNTVDLMFASHSLEHLNDLLAIMREIYRVCRHGAQVCIVAPYNNQSLNLANPYHKQVFNEHTPRFWTNQSFTSIDPRDYSHPQASSWGLSDSDHSVLGIDLRCIRMEFFYFPEYRYLPPDEQRLARQRNMNVCDTIMYHLIAIKQPTSDDELTKMTEAMDYYVPDGVMIRSLMEQLVQIGKQRDAAQLRVTQLEGELALAHSHSLFLEQQLTSTQDEWTGTQEQLTSTREQLTNTQEELTSAQEQLTEMRARADESDRNAQAIADRSGVVSRQLATAQQDMTLLDARRASAQWRAESAERQLMTIRRRAGYLWKAGTAIRNWRAAVINIIRNSDARNQVAPPFQQLRDDSFLFGSSLRGFRLQVSEDFSLLPYLQYPLVPGRAGLSGILLAPVLEDETRYGVLGVEIVSPDNQIVAQVALPQALIPNYAPARFDFPPIACTDRGRFWLRVFVRDSGGPVRVFEWRRHSILSLRKPARKAFCGLIFAISQG